MTKSTHRVEVVRLGPIRKHENADTLGVVDVWGYTCVVRLADWSEGALAAYIPPDSIVPATEPFAFLGDRRRIRVSRLRGILSQGLLIPAPEGATVGDDVAEQLGVTHYEPPCPLSTGGEDAPAPSGWRPCYDVDSLLRYAHVFEPGEPVWVTEKIHGASARYCWADDALQVGSRTAWKRESAASIWWKAVTPALVDMCRAGGNWTVYGEVYGQVQDLRYGAGRGEVRFAGFDIMEGNRWLNASEVAAAFASFGVPTVPPLGAHAFDLAALKALAEGPSTVPGADHVREGIVVKPMIERTHPEVGRVNLKIVGNGYLSRKD